MSQRDKKRLQAARNEPCVRCGREGETRAAHYCGFRQHALGKGRSLKAADEATAWLCHSCDDLFSESSYPRWEGGSKNIERSEEFLYLCVLTSIRRAEQ
ncbi:MAG TPA: hypothetical protein ENK38_02045 [Gammaproteobacteria bacterium]|nr:hypothetical protein [Gammaproteobacteria bacterium]